jgi:competence protein ComGC
MSKRQLHTHVHCSTIHKSQEMETLKCPSADGYIKKTQYTCTVEYYAATKYEILSFVAMWCNAVYQQNLGD